MIKDSLLAAVDHIRSVHEAEKQTKANRQKKFEVVLEAIKTQPYTPYLENQTFTSGNPKDSLSEFVGRTWINDDADELFEHVANRVLDALEKEGVII